MVTLISCYQVNVILSKRTKEPIHTHTCECVQSHYSHVQLFAIQRTHQAPLSLGLSRQEYWSVLPGPPPGDLVKSAISCFLHWEVGSLPLAPPGKTISYIPMILLQVTPFLLKHADKDQGGPHRCWGAEPLHIPTEVFPSASRHFHEKGP